MTRARTARTVARFADTLTPVPGTLANRLADADEERFVGRRRELRFFDRLLDGELDMAVVLVVGRAGIGKSTLLREVARRRGYFEPAASHEQAADELFLSRATSSRRLRTAAARLADYLVASQ